MVYRAGMRVYLYNDGILLCSHTGYPAWLAAGFPAGIGGWLPAYADSVSAADGFAFVAEVENE